MRIWPSPWRFVSDFGGIQSGQSTINLTGSVKIIGIIRQLTRFENTLSAMNEATKWLEVLQRDARADDTGETVANCTAIQIATMNNHRTGNMRDARRNKRGLW